MKNYDVIVLGLGAMGSAAVYQLAKKGTKVLGIDQFSPPHTLGSTHGDTRITRLAIGEGTEYVPLVLRANELWREIEKESGQELLTITGGLIMSNAKNSEFFNQTVASAEKYTIPHKVLSTEEIQERFPQFILQGESGYLEEGAGYLRPEKCIEAQLELAKKYGATLNTNEKVLSFRDEGRSVVVQTDKGEYQADKLIISAGSWVGELLGPELGKYFTVYRQVLYWFGVDGDISQFEYPQFPVWIWEFGDGEEDAMYGFPAIDGQHGGVKLATEQYTVTSDPNNLDRSVSKEEMQQAYEMYVKPHFNGLTDICIKSAACLYTVTPDHKFVIDVHPEFSNVIIASPCSGHGFKHSSAVGEILAELAIDGKTKLDISKFSLKRFYE